VILNGVCISTRFAASKWVTSIRSKFRKVGPTHAELSALPVHETIDAFQPIRGMKAFFTMPHSAAIALMPF